MKKIIIFFFILAIIFVLYQLFFSKQLDMHKTTNCTTSTTEIIKIKDSINGNSNVIFWQGFTHNWKINHRINRLGDWISNDTSFHTAASGSAADVLTYNSFYTTIQSNYIKTYSGILNTQIYGNEGCTTQKNISVHGLIKENLKKYNNATIVLNGFDLLCKSNTDTNLIGNGKADKLENFTINLKDIILKNNSFSFDILLKFGGNCDTPECFSLNTKNNNSFDYKVKIAYQIIFYNNETTTTKDTLLQQRYTWKKPTKGKPITDTNEIFETNYILKNNTIMGNQKYNIGIPLITSLEINLPKGKTDSYIRHQLETPHLLAFNFAIQKYSFNNGICTFDANLFFKNWTTQMHPLAFGINGEANIKMGLKFLQIQDKNAIFKPMQKSGKINWITSHFNQKNALDSSALQYHTIDF